MSNRTLRKTEEEGEEMGKKLDALFGRSFKAAKLNPVVNLAISRVAVLKNQRQSRSKHALSGVLQLLQLGHHERALLRVEHVIKEQDMMDVYDKIEGYCNLLIERVHLIEQERECPEELKEAIGGLHYAASRCGEFPELQEIRGVLTSRFGKEFAARAIELRNNCGVHPQMVQKLSTRMPSLERRIKALKEIASQNSIVLQLEEASSVLPEEELNVKKQNQPESEIKEEQKLKIYTEGGKYGELSDSFRVRQKYKDVADAAQAAFESAAYAAAAARAAVELYRSEPRSPHDHNNSPRPQPTKLSNGHDSLKVTSELEDSENQGGEEFNENTEELVKPKDISSSDSAEEVLEETSVPVNAEGKGENYERDDMQKSTHSSKQTSSHTMLNEGFGSKTQSEPHLDLQKRPFSVRTRRVRGY